jgi:hypothetical protein
LNINRLVEVYFLKKEADSRMTMQHDSILYEPISPLHASVDPRFSRLIRAANHREPANQQQVSLSNWPHSSSVFTVNSNAWSPAETTEKSINTKK